MIKNKKVIILLIISLSLFGFSSCNSENSNKNEASTMHTSEFNFENLTEVPVNPIGYQQISGEEAKFLMDTEEDFVIIDARTIEEYNEGHIEDAILIPEYEITEKAETLLKDKGQLILVYCRSGRRSKIASQYLAELGYTNVKEFGGIINWEYEVVK